MVLFSSTGTPTTTTTAALASTNPPTSANHQNPPNNATPPVTQPHHNNAKIAETLFRYTNKKYGPRLQEFLSQPRIRDPDMSQLYDRMLRKLQEEETNTQQQQRNGKLPGGVPTSPSSKKAAKRMQMEREKRKVMENIRKIRERRMRGNDTSVEQGNSAAAAHRKEGESEESANHLRHHYQENNSASGEPRRNNHHKRLSKSPLASSSSSTQDTPPQNDSFIAKTLASHSPNPPASPSNVQLRDSSKSHSSENQKSSESLTQQDASSSLISSSMPTFHDWLKRQNSKKQMHLPQNSPKNFDDWKQNRGKLRKELEECRVGLDQKVLQMQHSRRSLSPSMRSNSMRSISSALSVGVDNGSVASALSSPSSPSGTASNNNVASHLNSPGNDTGRGPQDLSPISIPRVSHHIYRTSPASPSPSNDRKNRPWNQNKLERRSSLGRMRSSGSILSTTSNGSSSSKRRKRSQIAESSEYDEAESADEDTESEDDTYLAEKLLYKLNKKYNVIRNQKTQILEQLRESGSTDDVRKDLSSLRKLHIEKMGNL